MYAGAALVLVSIGGVVVRGWAAWEPAVRWTFAGLTTVALIAAGLFVRLPWSRAVSDERRRAVSALLTTGRRRWPRPGWASRSGPRRVRLSAGPGQCRPGAWGVVLAMLVVNLIARTPVSESGAARSPWRGRRGWSCRPGPGTWAVLVGLGVAWAGLGMRWARGRRTAMVLGAALALVASVGMAGGPVGVADPRRAGGGRRPRPRRLPARSGQLLAGPGRGGGDRPGRLGGRRRRRSGAGAARRRAGHDGRLVDRAAQRPSRIGQGRTKGPDPVRIGALRVKAGVLASERA